MEKTKNTKTEDFVKIPPSDVQIEMAILGAILLEPDAILKVSDIITPYDFYKENHTIIYDTALSMFARNIPIDMLTVTNELRKSNKLEAAGGVYYISTLTANVASAYNIEKHAMIISELSMRRALIQESDKILKNAYDCSHDFDSVLENAITLIDRVTINTTKKAKVLNFMEGVELFMQNLSEKQKFDNKLNGTVKTRINTLLELVPEYNPGSSIVVAGRPGMGKTSFILNEVVNMVKQGNKVLFFSLEMTTIQLISRIIIRESGVTDYDMERKLTPFEYEKIDKAISRMQDIGLFIDETPAVSFAHVKAKTKIYKKTHNISAVVIDYLQLMSTDKSQPRERQIADLSSQLKSLAKEFEIPVFELTQLNRNAESRQNDGYRPKLSDLRESGAIEQDADIVLFPYRPEYYYPNDNELKGKAEIIVAKNRNGKCGDCNVDVNIALHQWTSQNALSSYDDKLNNINKESLPHNRDVYF